MTSLRARMRASTLGRAAANAPPLVAGFGWTALLAVAGTAGMVAAPLVVQRILDVHLGTDATVDVPAVLGLGSLGLTVAVLGLLANRWAIWRLSVAAAEGIALLRRRALAQVHRLPLVRLDEQRRGVLLARVTSDLDVVLDFFGWGGIGMLVGGAQVLGAVVAILVLSPPLALVAVVVATAYAAFLTWSQRVLARAHDGVRATVGESMAVVGETVSGFVTVRAYGVEDAMRARATSRVDEQYRAEFRAHSLGAVLFGTSELFAAALTAAVLAVGLVWLDTTVGALVAAMFLVAMLVAPIQGLVETLNEAQSALASLRRVDRLLDEPVEPDRDQARTAAATGRTATEEPTVLPRGALSVSVRGLRFAYPTGGDVLRDVSVELAAAQRVAVVGETGSGKTTLAKVVARLLRPTDGQVLVGGVPIDDVDRGELRDRVGFVPQEGFLFDATLRENLRRAAPGADDRRLLAQAERLGLDEWVASLADGLDTHVGERGGGLSAGERQLVALWRAALRGPDLLVLDEATSAVDPRLEVQLRAAIERLSTGRTILTVAHRLSTAEAADLVLVMDAGELVEQGTHDQLVAGDGVYARLHRDWTAGTRT